MNRDDYYSIAYIAVFGGAWGVSEILLGNMLHLFNIPFRGLIMSTIGCALCLAGSYLLPTKKGFPIIFMGLLAFLIKISSFGVFKINILLSIGIESILLQSVVWLLGYNIIGFAIAGMFAGLTPLTATFLLFNILYGQSSYFVYQQVVKNSGNFIAGITNSAIIILAALVTLHIVVGILSGLSAIYLGKKFSHAAQNNT